MTIAIALDGMVGGTFALQLAFEVPSHGVTALLGPSGSGKTTILRALAGLDRIPGTIIIDGQLWQHLPPPLRRGPEPPRSGAQSPEQSGREPVFTGVTKFVVPELRRTGYIFQGAGLLPHLTVAANLDYAARRAPPGPFARSDIIDRTGIAHLLDRSPARLSGGEAQRASIARALLSQPRLLLMDEPLSALDGDARGELLAWLEALLAAIGIPTFYVTHDHGEAARLAARTIRIKKGSIEV